MRIKEIKIQWMKDFFKKMLIKYGNEDTTRKIGNSHVLTLTWLVFFS